MAAVEGNLSGQHLREVFGAIAPEPEKYPKEFQPPCEDESIEDKVIRLLNYTLELRKSSAFSARKLRFLKDGLKELCEVAISIEDCDTL